MEHGFGPYLEVARIQSEMNKMFDVLLEMSGEDGEQGGPGGWIPSVDVCATSEGLVLRCEVPGVPLGSLKLTALSGAVIVSGERPRDEPGAQVRHHCVERLSGKFRRVIPLVAPINSRDARAVLRDGVLEVFFPKVSNRRGEEVVIKIQAAEGAR